MRSDDFAAFPSVPEAGANRVGMTLRDYFAAKAMQALIPLQFDSSSYGTNPGIDPGEGIALDAYAYADAMLKERAK